MAAIPEAVRWVFWNAIERRPRAGWRLLLGTVTFVVASIVAALGIGMLSALVLVTSATLPSLFAGQLLSNVVLTVSLVGLAWVADRRTIPDLGLGGRGWWANLAFGLVLGVVMTSAVFLVERAAGLVTVERVFVTRPALGIGAELPFELALPLVIAFFVAVGVGEEVFFRGYLMTNLAEGLNGAGPVGPRGAIGLAAILTSAIFGLVHLGNQSATLVSAFNITVVGLFLAGAYVVTEDLGISIGIHVTWNFSLSSVYGFPVSGITTPATVLDVRQTGDPLVTGGDFGPEAGLVVYLALAVAIASTWLWIRRTEGGVDFPTGVAVPDLRTTPDPDRE